MDMNRDLTLDNIKYTLEKIMSSLLPKIYDKDEPERHYDTQLYNSLYLCKSIIDCYKNSADSEELERRIKHLLGNPEFYALKIAPASEEPQIVHVYTAHRINLRDRDGFLHPVELFVSESLANDCFEFLARNKVSLGITGVLELAEYRFPSREMAQAYPDSGVKYQIVKAID